MPKPYITGEERAAWLKPLAYSVDDAARVSGFGPTTIWRWIADKKLRSIKIGGRTIIMHSDLEAFLESHRDKGPVDLNELGIL